MCSSSPTPWCAECAATEPTETAGWLTITNNNATVTFCSRECARHALEYHLPTQQELQQRLRTIEDRVLDAEFAELLEEADDE